MRVLIFLALALCLAACAQEGTVVRKEVRPFPFLDSLGVDAIFRFEVRDRAGYVHRQMVTPEVYARYRVGDYFNDRAPAPERPRVGPRPMLLPRLRPLEETGTRYAEPASIPIR